MTSRIQVEHERFLRRADEIAMMGNKRPPLIDDKVNILYGEISRLADRLKICREQQRRLLDVLQIISGIDWTVRQTNIKRKQQGDEDVPPEVLALRKLAEATGSAKVRRCTDGEIVRLSRVDNNYQGHPGRRNGLYFYSSIPKPAVYFFPLDGISVTTDPAYVPVQQTEEK